jgi:hypothetical protein
MGRRLARRAASQSGGVKRKRCLRCIVPFVEDAALEQPVPAEEPVDKPKKTSWRSKIRVVRTCLQLFGDI